MAFRFPLAGLLRLRQSQERQQEFLLHEANAHLAEVGRAMAEVELAAAELKASNASGLKAGIFAAELQFDRLRLTLLAKQRNQLERELTQAQDVCAQRRQALRHARGQREIVETLRDRQLLAYKQLREKQGQQQVEELFLLRRNFLRRG